MSKLANKVAVITGGASGIGEATARHFVDEGARVVIADLDLATGKQLETELRAAGADVLFVQADVSAEEDVQQVIDSAVSAFGGLDILFNNAGIGLPGRGHETTLTDWHKVISVNLDGAFLMSKYAIRHMKENGGGSIVNTSSVMGHVAVAEALSYNVTKHGILGMTKTLAIEYAMFDIRVNAVSPGYINTPMGRADVAEDPSIPQRHPMGRIGEPIEVARAVAFLASDEASFITGSSLLVDGGYTAQ